MSLSEVPEDTSTNTYTTVSSVFYSLTINRKMQDCVVRWFVLTD